MTFLVQCRFNGPRITKLLLLEESLNAPGTPLLRSIQVRWPLQRKVTEPEGTTMGCTKQRCSTLTTCTSCPSARLVPWPLRGLGTHSWLSKSFQASFLLQTLDFMDSTLSPSHFSASKAGYVCSLLPRIYLTPGRSSSVLIRAGPSTGWLNRSPHLLSGFILKPLSSPVNLALSPSMWIMFIHKHVLVSPLYLTEQAPSPVSHKSFQLYNSTLGELCLYPGSTHLHSTPIFPPFQWILNRSFPNFPLPTLAAASEQVIILLKISLSSGLFIILLLSSISLTIKTWFYLAPSCNSCSC